MADELTTHRCAICKAEDDLDALLIDCDPETGQPIGLLCEACSCFVDMWRSDPERLIALLTWKATPTEELPGYRVALAEALGWSIERLDRDGFPADLADAPGHDPERLDELERWVEKSAESVREWAEVRDHFQHLYEAGRDRA